MLAQAQRLVRSIDRGVRLAQEVLAFGRAEERAPAAEPITALVAFHPADDATRAAVTGSFHGRLTECAPWLGPPNGASPAT